MVPTHPTLLLYLHIYIKKNEVDNTFKSYFNLFGFSFGLHFKF